MTMNTKTQEVATLTHPTEGLRGAFEPKGAYGTTDEDFLLLTCICSLTSTPHVRGGGGGILYARPQGAPAAS